MGPVEDDCTFGVLYVKYVPAQICESMDVVKCEISGQSSHVIDDVEQTPVAVMKSFSCNSVKFVVRRQSATRVSVPSAFDRLTQSSRDSFKRNKLPDKNVRSGVLPADDKLFNDIVDVLQNENIGWTASSVASGHKHVFVLSRALFYMDVYRDQFKERGIHFPAFLDEFQGYNNPGASKHKTPQLSSERLQSHVNNLSSALLLPFLSDEHYSRLKSWGMGLCDAMQAMLSRLSAQNARSLANLESTVPAGDPTTDSRSYTVSSVSAVGAQYRALSAKLEAMDFYEMLDALEFAPSDRYTRRHWMDGLQATCTFTVYRYHPGGSCTSLVSVWKVPDDVAERSETDHAHCIAKALKLAPVFHTRRMKRDFLSKWHHAVEGKASRSFLKCIYAELTGDSRAATNKSEEETRLKLLKWLLDTDDSSLLLDYHNGSGRLHEPDFEHFWAEVEKYFNERELAVQERRHGETMYLPLAISLASLHRTICERLDKAHPGLKKPSIELLRLQFQPHDHHINAAARYTGKFDIRFAMQTRQFHGHHEDGHYGNAQFRYLREFAIAHQEECFMLCVDDKAVVPVGEPGTPLSTGVRGHNKSLMGVGESASVLTAADHDWHVAGVVPSVCLKVDVPSSIDESFYTGQITVTNKERVFQPSSPFRHACELEHILQESCSEELSNRKTLLLFSDGGPDHRVTYGSVQISLLSLFLKLDLDQLIALRTCPTQSWVNPAERCMSLLNLGLQNVSLGRASMEKKHEDVAKGCHSVADLRKAAEKHPDLREAYGVSMLGVMETLNGCFKQLRLKDVPVNVQSAASAEQIAELFKTVEQIDDTLSMDHLLKADLQKAEKLNLFSANHMQATHYSFQIKKCADASCSYCSSHPAKSSRNLAWLPSPEPAADQNSYLQFAEVYDGRAPTDIHRPSLKSSPSNHPADAQYSAIMNSNKVRCSIPCSECHKPRCVYSSSKLTKDQLESVAEVEASQEYVCGAALFDGGDLAGKAVVRQSLSCQSPVEVAYFSAKIAFPSCCFHCGDTANLLDDEDEYIAGMKRKYSVVRPLCSTCHGKGMDASVRSGIKTGGDKKRSKK